MSRPVPAGSWWHVLVPVRRGLPPSVQADQEGMDYHRHEYLDTYDLGYPHYLLQVLDPDLDNIANPHEVKHWMDPRLIPFGWGMFDLDTDEVIVIERGR